MIAHNLTRSLPALSYRSGLPIRAVYDSDTGAVSMSHCFAQARENALLADFGFLGGGEEADSHMATSASNPDVPYESNATLSKPVHMDADICALIADLLPWRELQKCTLVNKEWRSAFVGSIVASEFPS